MLLRKSRGSFWILVLGLKPRSGSCTRLGLQRSGHNMAGMFVWWSTHISSQKADAEMSSRTWRTSWGPDAEKSSGFYWAVFETGFHVSQALPQIYCLAKDLLNSDLPVPGAGILDTCPHSWLTGSFATNIPGPWFCSQAMNSCMDLWERTLRFKSSQRVNTISYSLLATFFSKTINVASVTGYVINTLLTCAN